MEVQQAPAEQNVSADTNGLQNNDTVTAPEPTTNSPSPDLANTFNVYVGNLSPESNEQDLADAFGQCGKVVLCRVFRDKATGAHMGFGFVHFETKEAQMKALSPEFSHPNIKGTVAYAKEAVEKTTLFVGNLPHDMNEAELRQAFQSKVGNFTNFELKTGPPPQCASRGFCFVSFADHQAAENARKILCRTTLRNRTLHATWAEPLPSARDVDEETMSKVSTLYVTQIAADVTDEQLKELFAQYGELTKCHIVRNPDTNESRGFAFIDFKVRDQCVAAMNALNGSEFHGGKLSVVLAKPPPTKKGSKPGPMRQKNAPSNTLFAYDSATGRTIPIPRDKLEAVVGTRLPRKEKGRKGPKGWKGFKGNRERRGGRQGGFGPQYGPPPSQQYYQPPPQYGPGPGPQPPQPPPQDQFYQYPGFAQPGPYHEGRNYAAQRYYPYWAIALPFYGVFEDFPTRNFWKYWKLHTHMYSKGSGVYRDITPCFIRILW
jgi:RNA recognition motif-containing protein